MNDAKMRPGAPTDNSGPNRFIEILRRLILVAGFLAATGMALHPADALLRVRTVDFAKSQKQHASRMSSDIKMMARESGADIDPSINTAAHMTLEQYIADETRGRLLEVESRDWLNFYDSAVRTLTGRSTDLAHNLGHGIMDRCLYFPLLHAPLSQLTGKIRDDNRFLFVAIKDGTTVKYLEVIFQRPGDLHRYAPAWLLYPFRQHAVWFFIAGLLGYALLPWYCKGPQELCYSTARSVVVPDLLGAVMTTLFFAAPLLIITANAPTSTPLRLLDFSAGWGVLTAIMWAFAAGFASITVIALWYSTLSIVLLPTGIRKRTLLSTNDYPFASMTDITPISQDWPKWLKVISWLVFIFGSARNSMMIGGMLLTRQIGHGMAIRCNDGRTLKIWINNLPGFEYIPRALRKAGVPMDAELGKIVDEDLAGATTTPQEGKTGSSPTVLAWILMLVVISGALIVHFKPEKLPRIELRLQFTNEALAQRMALLKQMEDVSNQMQALSKESDQILANPASASKTRVAEIQAANMKLINQFQELSKQHDAIQPTEEE